MTRAEYFREREPVTIDLPEHVLAHMAKEQQRLVAEATEQMNSRTEGQTPPSSFPGKDRRRLFSAHRPSSRAIRFSDGPPPATSSGRL